MKIQRVTWRMPMFIVVGLFSLILLGWIHETTQVTYAEPLQHLNNVQATSVQATPTLDPTVTALQKEQLEHQNDWLWNFGSTLISTLAVLIAGIFAFMRWLGDRRDAREKQQVSDQRLLEDRQAERKKQEEEQKRLLEDRQAEREKQNAERFQAVVIGLGSNVLEARVGAAIMLRTFLYSDYEQFYGQAFDLAVAYLRPRTTNPDTSEPLDSLNQALIAIFKESFHFAREQLNQAAPYLDAARIKLDQAYLAHTDLKQAWMPNSFLREADLSEANLSGANLSEANLSGANLSRADLNGTLLSGANFSRADLTKADLSNAIAMGANFTESILSGAGMDYGDFREADFTGAKLGEASLNSANMHEAKLKEAVDLDKANTKNTGSLTLNQLPSYMTAEKGTRKKKGRTRPIS